MVNKLIESKRMTGDMETVTRYLQGVLSVVQKLTTSCIGDDYFDQMDATPIPSQDSIIEIIQQARRILFPGHFAKTRIDPVNLEGFLGKETTALYENLSEQIVFTLHHDCLRDGQSCSQCMERSYNTAYQFIQGLPGLKAVLATDICAAMDGDPAAKSYNEIISSYPGLFAITVYRMAHTIHEMDIPLLPRMMTEYAHGLTGIDIHPGAEIGESFFIDHGTGVVIGETTEIGHRVRLYQGVTLGALSLPKGRVHHFRDRKRHPTIEDDVIIYSNATLLGADAVVGARSIIGGNVWITESVPPDTKVILKRPELVFRIDD